MKRIFVIIVFFLIYFNIVTYSQEKINFSAGIGYAELLNLGMYFQSEQIQIGLSYGSWPRSEIYSISSDLKFHMGDSSQYSNRKCWFILFGYIYSKSENRESVNRIQLLNFRFGRDINISKKFGFNISIGTMGVLSDETERKTCFTCPLGGVSLAFLPGIGIELFYRIY